MTDLVADYLRRWAAEPDGAAFSTPSSILAPARRGELPVMLKIATEAEEARGNHLMAWWNGVGAATVLEHDDNAVLLERAVGTRSLVRMAESGGDCDDEATRILCLVGTHLHAFGVSAGGASAGGARVSPVVEPPSDLIGLEHWFRDLFTHAAAVGGVHARAAVIAGELLADQREIRVLHGDLHHGNVLDFGAERHPRTDGWLAIDPKYLIGDRAFDFTNILCNPTAAVAQQPGRFARQLDVIAETAGLERERLLRWSVAWCALSSSWPSNDGQWPRSTIALGLEAERMLAAG
jgi:streptomycin 6-kinase